MYVSSLVFSPQNSLEGGDCIFSGAAPGSVLPTVGAQQVHEMDRFFPTLSEVALTIVAQPVPTALEPCDDFRSCGLGAQVKEALSTYYRSIL